MERAKIFDGRTARATITGLQPPSWLARWYDPASYPLEGPLQEDLFFPLSQVLYNAIALSVKDAVAQELSENHSSMRP